MQTPTGNTSTLALGTGRPGQLGIPDGGLIRYGTMLPISGSLVPEEKESGQTNPSGFIRRGVPGKKQGAASWKHPLTAAHLLEFLLHLLGSSAKTTLATGIYQYVYTPKSVNDVLRIVTHFWGLLDKPPVECWVLYAIMFGSIELDIKDNEEIPVTLKGIAGHGTKLSPATPDGDNVGTYAKGPWVRGVIADKTAGKLWIQVTDDDPALKFKILQAETEPDAGDFTAAAHEWTVPYDAAGNAEWQYAQASDTGLDLGVFTENKDPLEIIFPGNATDHAAAAVGDLFVIDVPGTWTAPATSELAGSDRFTSAHWLTRFRAIGAPAWISKPVNTGKVGLSWEIEPDRGNSSRYPFDILRTGDLEPMVELERSFVDSFFSESLDLHARIEGQLQFEGRQLSATYREGILFDFPSLAVKEAKSDVDKEGKVVEKLKLVGETNDEGDPPVTITVITSRNWTVPTA